MKRLISVIISIIVLIIIYSQLNIQEITSILSQCNTSLILFGALLTIPLLFLQSLRLKWIVDLKDTLSIGESFRLISLANTLNFILPSKLGDLSKAYFLSRNHNLKKPLSISIIVYEKILDLIGLVTTSAFGLCAFGFASVYPLLTFLMVFGTFFTLWFLFSRKLVHFTLYVTKKVFPAKLSRLLKPLYHYWICMQHETLKHKKTLPTLIVSTFLISMGHYFQLWIMYRSIVPTFPFSVHLALSPMTLAAGLLPVAFSGIGTRDAAIVLTFSSYISEEASASLGIIATLRMLVLALPGVFFIKTYLKNKSDINSLTKK